MINLICILMLHITTDEKDYWTNVELKGRLIEVKGDSYLVDFDNRVELVNSNLCLEAK